VPIFRDKSGARRLRFRRLVRGVEYFLTRFTQLELLRGCNSPHQWEQLSDYLEVQRYAEAKPTTWADAARMHFDLRRAHLAVRSILDCCIAQIALDHQLTLLHNDGDFERIAEVRPLRARRFDIQA
jgi:hypothetical protein